MLTRVIGRVARRLAQGFVLLVLAWIVGLAVWAQLAAAPALGVVSGALTPCPPTPNCVTTHQGESVLPTWPTHGDARATLDRIQQVVEAQPRARVTARSDRYLRAEFRSRLFRYVDDVEFLVVEPDRVHFRSASRIGRSDMGVNRARMEALRASYERP